jgi:3'-5' exoribonuclease
VWNLARTFADVYPGRFDRDLLLCGAALHDVGKIKSYQLKTGISEKTVVGDLLDHVFISASMVSNLWDKIMTEDVVGDDAEEAAREKAMLLHVILSHHGRKEWGSPVLPQCPEAVLLHFCDQISATMRSCFDAIEATQDGADRTDWLTIMDNARKLVVPTTQEDSESDST